MKTNTKEFCDIIKALLPATKNKNASSQIEQIIFQDDFAGTFNEKIAISYNLKLGEIQCSVSANDLYNGLSGITEEEIDIKLKDDQLIISSNSTNVRISTIKDSKIIEDFYTSINLNDVGWTDLPENFIKKLNLIKFSASDNDYDSQNLNCIFIDDKFIYASNGYRCTKIECDTGFSVLLPKSSVDQVTKFSGINAFSIGENWIHFANNEGGIISSKIVKGNFFDITNIMNKFNGGTNINLSKKLIKPLNHINSASNKKSDFLKNVTISVTKGQTILSGGKEGLAIDTTIPNKFTGKEIKFNISPIFLKEIIELDICKTMRITGNVALFESDGFSHLVTLFID